MVVCMVQRCPWATASRRQRIKGSVRHMLVKVIRTKTQMAGEPNQTGQHRSGVPSVPSATTVATISAFIGGVALTLDTPWHFGGSVCRIWVKGAWQHGSMGHLQCFRSANAIAFTFSKVSAHNPEGRVSPITNMGFPLGTSSCSR